MPEIVLHIVSCSQSHAVTTKYIVFVYLRWHQQTSCCSIIQIKRASQSKHEPPLRRPFELPTNFKTFRCILTYHCPSELRGRITPNLPQVFYFQSRHGDHVVPTEGGTILVCSMQWWLSIKDCPWDRLPRCTRCQSQLFMIMCQEKWRMV